MARQTGMLVTALGVLGFGAVYYALAREPEHVYFLSHLLPNYHSPAAIPGTIGQNLPTFIHVYAFILLTVAVTAPTSDKLIRICMAWFTVDGLFEIAQLKPFAHWIAAHTPTWFTGIPFLENTTAYFVSGTFDPLDLASIAMGALAAYFTATILQARGS